MLTTPVLKELKHLLTLHHNLYDDVRCTGIFFEKLLAKAFLSAGFQVSGSPQDQTPGIDLSVSKFGGISCKSGYLQYKFKGKIRAFSDNTLRITSHKTATYPDLTDKVDYIKSIDNYDYLICLSDPFRHKTNNRIYLLSVIPKTVFDITTVSDWKMTRSQASGYTSRNIRCVFDRMNELFLYIPLNLAIQRNILVV